MEKNKLNYIKIKIKIDKLENENKNINKDIELLKRNSDSLLNNLRILNNQYELVKQELSKANIELDNKVKDTEKLNEVKFSNVKDSLERNTLYWILCISLIIKEYLIKKNY